MSDSNRLLFAAAAIGVAICALIWSVVGALTLTQQGSTVAVRGSAIEQGARADTDEDRRHRRWSRATPRGVLEDVESPTTEACEDDTDCREQEDLRAQQSVALATSAILSWTRWQTIIAVLGTALLWWGLLLNRDATVAATSQAETARLTLEAERRAWVGVTEILIAAPLKYQPVRRTLQTDLEISIRNFGQTPALRVSTHIAAAMNPHVVAERLKELREKARREHGLGVAETTVFPTEKPYKIPLGVEIAEGDLDQAVGDWRRTFPSDQAVSDMLFLPTIYGVIAYASPLTQDKAVHTTTFAVHYVSERGSAISIGINEYMHVTPRQRSQISWMGWDAD